MKTYDCQITGYPKLERRAQPRGAPDLEVERPPLNGFHNAIVNARDGYWRGYLEAMRKGFADYVASRGTYCPPNHLPVHVGIIEEIEIVGRRCLDSGACHHGCKRKCVRREDCVPLSLAASYLTDRWELKPSTSENLQPQPVSVTGVSA